MQCPCIIGCERIASTGRMQDRGQHIAGFDRGQLVGIAQQDQLRAIGNGLRELAHQRQVDHRGLVHHHDVERQRVVGVVAEARRVRNGAEQAMQGAGLRGQGIQPRGLDAVRGHLRNRATQAVRHAVGGAAGGRGEGDAQCRLLRCVRLRDAHGEQLRNGGGLAGAGAAGDQQQRATQGECGGAGLVVAFMRSRKQRREQGCDTFDCCFRHHTRGDAPQLQGEAAFVFAIAAQIQQAMLEDERRGLRFLAGRCRRGNEARCGQRLHPRIGVRPGDLGIDQLPRRRGIETGMAVGDRERGQCGSGQHLVRGGRIEPAQGARQRIVQRAQCAGLLQGTQQAHATAPSVAWPNSASSACTSSGAKRCAWMPGESLRAASRPRQNR